MKSGSQRDAHRPLVVDAATSARLGRVRQRGTGPGLRVRELLRQIGVRPGGSKLRLTGSPDIVNISAGWCIFVHGCFWHAHARCPRATVPTRNRAFWQAKFDANRRRDRRVVRELRQCGMKVIVIWECAIDERPGATLRRLRRLLLPAQAAPPTSRKRELP